MLFRPSRRRAIPLSCGTTAHQEGAENPMNTDGLGNQRRDQHRNESERD